MENPYKKKDIGLSRYTISREKALEFQDMPKEWRDKQESSEIARVTIINYIRWGVESVRK